MLILRSSVFKQADIEAHDPQNNEVVPMIII